MEINTTLDTLIKISNGNKLFYFHSQYDDGTNTGEYYSLFSGIYPNVYRCSISSVEDIAEFELNKSIYTECQTEGDCLALAYDQISVKLDSAGRIAQVSEPRVGNEVVYTTHNFCDPCTWFSESIRIENEQLSTSDNLSYSSPGGRINWIDMVSGRLQDDDGLVEEQKLLNPSNPHGYQVIVKVNNITKTPREPFESSGGDYSINFEDGIITFFNALSNLDVVKCSYSYASTSGFYLKPLPNKDLYIEGAESDFSIDVVMTDGIEYQINGYVDSFAPQYMFKYLSGTSTISASTVTGVGTEYLEEVEVGDYVRFGLDDVSKYCLVQTINSDTSLTLSSSYTGNSSGILIVSKTYTGIYPSKTKIPLKSTKYKRFSNITQEGIGAYPILNAIGSTSNDKNLSLKGFRSASRGMKSAIQTIPFKYSTLRLLKASDGLEVKIKTSHDRALEGESGTLTFYCTSK